MSAEVTEDAKWSDVGEMNNISSLPLDQRLDALISAEQALRSRLGTATPEVVDNQ